jgi:putative sugar O-methyltransferase
MASWAKRKIAALRFKLKIDPLRLRRLKNTPRIFQAARLFSEKGNHSVLFVTSLLRAREIKMAKALRAIGWRVVLIYIENTPFKPEGYFDIVIKASSESEAHIYGKLLSPPICHVFSGAVDGLLYRFCAEKPGPVVIDMNDIFCSALFDYCQERFDPTRECLERADGLCSRDLQAKSAERLDGFMLPRHTLLFPEYVDQGVQIATSGTSKTAGEVHVVSVGTFTLERQGMYDSGYLRLAEMLTEQKIHFHIYPHWFYRKSSGSAFNLDLREDFIDFFKLQETTPYLHIHESLSPHALARALPQYDFGILAGGSKALGQKLKLLHPEYMKTCYSGRISDYLSANLMVLINKEVKFNYWLLKRYGVFVDLDDIHKSGFRDKLLAIKHDPTTRQRAKQTAGILSTRHNIHRLAAFYERIIADTQDEWVRIGYPFNLFASLPLIGRSFRELNIRLQQISQTASRLRNDLCRKEKDFRRQLAHPPMMLEEYSDADPRDIGKQPLRRRSMLKAKVSLEIERGSSWATELSGLLNWPEIRNQVEQTTGMPELIEMIQLFGAGDSAISTPSSCWQALGFKNFNQLLRDGYNNFKRTIGSSYFNFLVQAGDPQIAFLEGVLSAKEVKACAQVAASLPDDPAFSWHDQRAYRYFVLMLWAYARQRDTQGFFDRLREPEEGNPLTVPSGKDLASQDLANSVLEYYSMAEAVDFAQCRRVLEIGGGYGRDAFVTLSLNPQIQYTLVDIPPALWIAQRYLSSVFPERKVFRVRDFQSYDAVKDEMATASIVFLLPHQLNLIPDRHFDFSLNISSFGEMQEAQVVTYFKSLERVTRGHFYMKQWKVSQNAFDNLALTEDSYPIPKSWKRIFSRTCAVQQAFFESAFSIR